MTTLSFPARPQLVRPVVVQTSVCPISELKPPIGLLGYGPLLTDGVVRTEHGLVSCVVVRGMSPMTYLEFVWHGNSYFWTETQAYSVEALSALAVDFAALCIAGTITNTPPSEARS